MSCRAELLRTAGIVEKNLLMNIQIDASADSWESTNYCIPLVLLKSVMQSTKWILLEEKLYLSMYVLNVILFKF